MKSLIAIASISLIFFACSSSQNVSWPKQMNEMLRSVKVLLPYAYEKGAFNKRDNHKVIEKELNRFVKSAHKISPDLAKNMLGDDPLVQFSINRLGQDLESALKSFNEGHYMYSQALVRSSLNHCIRCHTREKFGPELNLKNLDYADENLSPAAKAKIYMATRQYKKAEQEYKNVLGLSESFYSNPSEIESALKEYMALVVKIEKDPVKARKIVDDFLSRDHMPLYLAETVKTWKKSIAKWANEKNLSGLKGAKRLIKRAQSIQDYPNDQSADIEYLRATGMINEALRGMSDNKSKADAFLMLGESYEVLSDLGFWELPELYFEACIYQVPKTATAKKCYKNFERSLIWGFSGSAGTFIPNVEQQRLKKLRGMAGI